MHKSLPSMLTLCQMKIKEHLLNRSLQNVDKLFLPNNLKQNLQHFCRSTIKGFLPDPKDLRSFVCNPLKSHLRLQCTMKRIDNETTENSTRITNNLPGATYVLYIEYLGGLIPLLTAKRISKICPDFIIFDPQTKSNHLSSLSSSKTHTRKRKFLSSTSHSNTFHSTSSALKQTKLSNSNNNNNNNNNRTNLIINRNSIHAVDNVANNSNAEDLVTTRSSSGFSSDNDPEYEHEDEQEELYDDNRNSSQEKYSRRKATAKIVEHKHVRQKLN